MSEVTGLLQVTRSVCSLAARSLHQAGRLLYVAPTYRLSNGGHYDHLDTRSDLLPIYPSPKMARAAPREKLGYVVILNPDGTNRRDPPGVWISWRSPSIAQSPC
jgi:hypothetical protein